jgi:hypothetical protein
MLASTGFLRGSPLRIGRLTKELALPRPVELRYVVGAVAGGLLGLVVGLVAAGVTGATIFLYGGVSVGAMAGVAVVYAGATRGESLLRTGMTAARHASGQIELDGLRGKVYIGVAPVTSLGRGPSRLLRAMVDVEPRRAARLLGLEPDGPPRRRASRRRPRAWR